ncbi:MAG: hypothetical protein AAGA23_07760, partial [Pseudomonadota bacterium]
MSKPMRSNRYVRLLLPAGLLLVACSAGAERLAPSHLSQLLAVANPAGGSSLPPRFLGSAPANGAVNVSVLNPVVAAVFDQELSATAQGVMLSCGGTPVTLPELPITASALVFEADLAFVSTCQLTLVADQLSNASGQTLDGDGDGVAEGSPQDDVVITFATTGFSPPEGELLVGTAFAEPGGLATVPIDLRTSIRRGTDAVSATIRISPALADIEAVRCTPVPTQDSSGDPTGTTPPRCFLVDAHTLQLDVPNPRFRSDDLAGGRVAELDLRLVADLPEGASSSVVATYENENFVFGAAGTVTAARDFSGLFDRICPSEIPAPPDRFEPDNTLASAQQVAPRIAAPASALGGLVFEEHNFHTEDDEDWLVLPAGRYDVVVDLRASGPGTGLMMDQSLGRGSGLLVQFFDENGTLLPAFSEVDRDSNNPTYGGVCFDPLTYDSSFGPVTGRPNQFYAIGTNNDGPLYIRISQCRTEGLDEDGSGRDDRDEYCLSPSGAVYGVRVSEGLEASPALVEGRVVDADSGEPIALAAVLGTQVVNFTSFSNFDGVFRQDFTRLNEPAQARIEREGYLPVTIEFQADSRERIECGDIPMTRDAGQAPDLRPLSPGVEPNITVEGAAVTTSVFVSNVGDEASGATNVSFVASDDPVID